MSPVFGAVVLFANSPLAAVEVPLPPIMVQTASDQQAPVATPESPVPAAPVVPPQTAPVAPPITAQTPVAPDQAAPAGVPAQNPPGDPLVDEDILVSARRRSPIDPMEQVNVQSYKAVQALDGAVVAPIARGYKKGLPKPVRDGIHNFLDHIQEPIVFLNYLLQLKPGKAAETLGRFAINSTVGLAGVVDVAKRKPFKLPHRPNSLANTLGYYGVKPGPYFFLPLVGPTTLRDLFGITIDRLILPVTIGTPFNKAYYTLPVNTLSALDYRVAFDDTLTVLHTAYDPYAATRDDYLRKRKAEIDHLHGPNWPGHQVKAPRVVPTITPTATPAPDVAPLTAAPAPGTEAAPVTIAPAAPVSATPALVTPTPGAEAKVPEAATPTP